MFTGRKTVVALVALTALGAIAYGVRESLGRDRDMGRSEPSAAANRGPDREEVRERVAAFREIDTAGQKTTRWSFDADKPGQIATGWTNVTGTWQVMADETAASRPNVLAQISKEHTGNYFNVAVADAPVAKDVEITVRSKGVTGQEDQGGGPVWRFRDIRNYYIARQNNLEDNYRVYKVVDGRRIQLGSADLRAPTGTWHTLKVTMAGSQIECFFDNKKYLDVEDNTFKDAGKVGLWTKSDAQTHFDDFKVVVK